MTTDATEQTLETIGRAGIVAIIRLDDLSAAAQLARALLAGGITALEFTLTNPDAIRVVRELRAQLPDFDQGRAVIGVGTVMSPEAALEAIEAGAQFIVSPSTDLRTITRCHELGVACMPGAMTPTEIVAAWEAGASAVKVFPARALGPGYLKDIREPLPHIRLMPTGGIGPDNIADYLQAGAFAVGMGGNLLDKQLIRAGDWQALTDGAARVVERVRQARSEG
jgi:2-dehydro-3-deoxyphosphogluconate aldolase/(4S)-4-hydroxy-2-oxoglutarate aldolase